MCFVKESPLYVRTYDFLLWLILRVQKFPKVHRFALSERIQRVAFDFQDSIIAAGKTKGSSRKEYLYQADIQLAQLRIWIRMARDLEALSIRRYKYAAQLISEIGRLLGAWIKKVNSSS